MNVDCLCITSCDSENETQQLLSHINVDNIILYAKTDTHT